MSTETTADSTLEDWYRERIGTPGTGDEILGYFVFAVGVVLGIVGILLFIPSEVSGSMRQWAIVVAAAGLALLLAGPLIRLPLRRGATTLVYLGLLLCAVAIVWFVTVYPSNWGRSATTNAPSLVIGIYALGALAMTFGGIFVPMVTTRAQKAAVMLEDEVEDLRRTLVDLEADEEDLAAAIEDLRLALADAKADEEDIAAVAASLRGDLEDTRADEADLADELRTLRESSARFELYEDRGGQYRWRLRHRNNNVIADSGQGYTRRHNAQKGLQSVKRNALGAFTLHIESEEELPDEQAAFEDEPEAKSRATFEYYEDAGGKHRWRLRHDNGNIIADSGEGYSSQSALEDAIERIRAYVGPASYLRFDPTGFEVYEDAAGQYRWRLVHRNGNILADSGEGYTRAHDARRAVSRIQKHVDDYAFDVYEDAQGKYRWHLESSNGEIVADSGEGYSDRSSGEEAVDRVENYAPDADTLEIGQAAFEIFEDQAGEYRWRLRHRNGNIMADGGEGYADRSNARDGIESVKLNAPNAQAEAVED